MQTKLRQLAENLGADLVGFCQLPTPPVKDFPQGVYAVSVAVKLSDGILKTIEGQPSFGYFQHYRTANTLLDQIAFRLAREIEKRGHLALPVAASQSLGKNNPYIGLVPHKTVAVLSGLGFVGKAVYSFLRSTAVKSVLRPSLPICLCTANCPSLKTVAGIVKSVKRLVPRARFTV